MPPRSEEEKARRKEAALKRKQERERKKAEEEKKKEDFANSLNADQSAKKAPKSLDTSKKSVLLDLPEDALKQVFCFLPSADLGKVTLTCKQMNQALPEIRITYLLSRLRQSASPTLGSLGFIDMCQNEEEARLILEQSFEGGDTGRVKGKKKGKGADEFVSYARFLEDVVHGYSPLSFRVDGVTAMVPAYANGRVVSASPEHTLIRAGGDGQKCGAGGSGVASFGVGKRGQLGHGKREDLKTPRLITGGIGFNGIRIVQVSAGGGLVRVAHSLLLSASGRVFSFGTGQYGALGHGYSAAKQLPDILRPALVESLAQVRCVCVSAGELHSAAVTSDGDVYTWGDGFCGQLGHGDKRPQVLPKQIESGGLEDECVMSISCGSRHTLAVTEDGEVFSWGLGHFGAIGRSFTPFEYDADAAVVALGGEELGGAGAVEAMVEDPDRDENFQRPNAARPEFDLAAHLDLINNLSLEDSSNQCYPVVIESLQSVKCLGVSAGHRHSLVLDEHGGVYSFGAGRTGCLGHGDNGSQAFPVRISEFMSERVRIMKISAGVDMSMAVSTTGIAYSWGTMKGGRIGLGMSNSTVTLPRQVRIKDSQGRALKTTDVDCGYVHSLIVGLNGTIHLCGGVGIDGEEDGQEENTNETTASAGYPREISDFNVWHRVREPREQVKQTKWKKYGKYEVKGRKKMLEGDD